MSVVTVLAAVPLLMSWNAAASNNPLANALDRLIQRVGMAFEKIKGMTPSPVASAVKEEYQATVVIVGIMAPSPRSECRAVSLEKMDNLRLDPFRPMRERSWF